jgi:hypothetical protein
MGASAIRVWLLAAAATGVVAACAAGQEPVRPPVTNGSDDSPAPRPEQSPLQLWLQPDKNGVLVPVPVFAPDDEGELKQHVLSWSDIDRLLDRIADQQSPRVSCQRVSVAGVVNGRRANLELDLTFVTSPQRWVRAPLGLASAVISSMESPTGGFLDFDEKDGFVFWMPPAPSPEKAANAPSAAEAPGDVGMPTMSALQLVERPLRIKASVAVSESGTEKRLSVRIPRAPTSRLELLVDLPEAQANLVGSDALLKVEAAGTGESRITAEGVGGDVAVFWRPKRPTTPAAAPVLKAQGIIDILLGEGDQIQASARLTVQSLSEPFQAFTVKLPPGMRLALSQSPEYEVTPSESDEADADERRRVVVRLRQPTIGPVVVHLDADSGPQPRTTEFVEVGGFEIEEAVEQRGRVFLVTQAEQSVSWVESANIVQSSDPAPTGEGEEADAQFRYFAQPFSLLVKAAPQKTRVRVEPTYVIEVFSDYVKLTADLAYQIHGAKAGLVRVDLQGWELESVGGDDVVNPAVKHDQLAPLEVPFRAAVSGDVTVRLTARRIVEGAKGSLRIPLPAPVADFVVSAVVAVAPNDNIELTPLPGQMHGLLPEPPAPLELAISRKATLFYRTRTGEPQPVFAAGYEVKSGEVTVEAAGEVRLQEQRAAVHQEFTYKIAYEPLDRLAIDVPREAFERGELQLLFDEAPIVPKAEEEHAGGRILLYLTPPMALGRHVLAIEYILTVPQIAPQQTVAYSLPLAVVAPADSQSLAPQVLSNTLRVVPTRPLQAAPDGSAWTVRSPRPAGAGREEMALAAEGAEAQLPLMITHQKSDEQLSNAVDRLWLQTWLTATQRRDHAALQVTTHEESFRVRLPSGADPASLIVVLGGLRMPADAFSVKSLGGDEPAEVTLDLPSSSSQFTLEFWYGYTTRRDPGWRTRLAAPEFLDVSWVRQVYWQLVLPPDEHLAAPLAGFTSEHAWRRSGWWWGRQPSLGQRELERWINASEQPAPVGANEYLFSSFGAPDEVEIYTVPRTAAILGWSGLVLVLGLLLLRISPRRQLRWVAHAALVASLTVIAALALVPEAAMLAIQCAAIGAVGVAVAWFFARLGRRPSRPPVLSGPSSIHSRASASISTRSERRPPAASAGLPHDASS